MQWFLVLCRPRQLLLFLCAASAVVLGSALIGQYFFHLAPCDLCIMQRWPHLAVIVLAGFGAMQVSRPRLHHAALWLCCIALLVGAGIAFYHSGVEYGWFKGPDACSGGGAAAMSIDELRAQIAGAPLVSCAQAMAYIFGLSMAMWNVLVSLGMVAVVIIGLRYKVRKS